MQIFDLWTDGASGGKSDTPGGWAAILLSQGGDRLVLTGCEPSTTNNRMELLAVVRGLEALGDQTAIVTIFTDSGYVKHAFTREYVKNWQANGWISSRGDPVANQDLWQQLIAALDGHFVKWRLVKGHQKIHALNNEVDALAVAAKKAQSASAEFVPAARA